ncbi:unnamed protein product [Caenorhabditis brenneri]
MPERARAQKVSTIGGPEDPNDRRRDPKNPENKKIRRTWASGKSKIWIVRKIGKSELRNVRKIRNTWITNTNKNGNVGERTTEVGIQRTFKVRKPDEWRLGGRSPEYRKTKIPEVSGQKIRKIRKIEKPKVQDIRKIEKSVDPKVRMIRKFVESVRAGIPMIWVRNTGKQEPPEPEISENCYDKLQKTRKIGRKTQRSKYPKHKNLQC